jgi:HAE1 family hydrophobic/amphiphilic exporter-1
MSLPAVSIRRPVATAMLYLALLVIGFVSLRSLAVDLLPQIEFTELTIRVRYPNVGPEEIEQIITDPIENAVAGLPSLERVTSRSEEGSSRVRLEFARGTNVDEAANDLRAALDRIRDDLPIEADTPEIFKLDVDNVEVVSLAATGTRDLEQITRILEREIAPRFKQIAGVGSITLRGGIYRQIRVDVARDRLRSAGLTILDVQDALARDNVQAAGGNVRQGLTDLYVRPRAEFESVEAIAATVLRNEGGRPVRIRDVAEVKDDYEDPGFLVEINGVPSVSVGVQKQSGANTVEVARQVREEAERVNAERGDLHLTVIFDQSNFIQQSIDSVRTSALWGSFLAILILYLFLRSRASTAIIALAIPISVISAFGLLYFAGMTLNQMTFGGLALGVGMIVDNAIVVLESIVRKREEEGLSPAEGARTGAEEVAGAILASTLTTCVIFLPVVFTSTTSGALFQALALVVVFALACSLFVALTIVPMLAGRVLRTTAGAGFRGGGRFARVERQYQARLRGALARPRRVFVATAAAVAVAALCFPLIPVELAPPSDADEIDVDIEMAEGTSMAVVRAYVGELDEKVRAALPPDTVDFVSTEVRGGDAEVELKLAPADRRAVGSTELADRLRRAVDGQIPGAEIRVRAQPGLWILRRIFSSGGGDEALEVELRGFDLDRADDIAAEIRRRMDAIPGITDAQVGRREGRPEENLRLDRARIAELGLSVRDVARTVQGGVGGAEASRFREGGDEFPIVVRLRPEDRHSADDLQSVSLRTPSGELVPLSTVVRRDRARGPTEIQRVDGQRVTYVTAGLEGGMPLGEAVERVRASVAGLALPEGWSIGFGGEYVEQQRAARDFSVAIVMALALVYMLMAAQFERLLDPLIVMLSVPVALVGVVPALLLTGTTLNIQSIMGLVMLVGIVVNNAIVLVDAVNMLRRERRMSAVDAVLEAGRLRLRPILMTTSTTVFGLLPLAVGWGPGAEIQAPLARVVIGGLTASTLVTLVLVPVAYVSANGAMGRLKARRWREPEAAGA